MELVAVLLIAGLVLVLLETVLPGMVAGVVGFGCLVAGVVVSYSRFGPATGNWVLVGVAGTLVVLGVLWIRFFPTSRFGRVFVSRGTVGSLGVEKPDLLNCNGIALTNLRPSGTAEIQGKRVDVLSEGEMIERGALVRVVAVEGMRVVVRMIESDKR